MTIELRSALPDDLPAVLRLWLEAGAEPSHTDDLPSLALLLGHDPHALVVAAEDGRIVGSVIAAWDGWRGSIYRLAVAPSRRRAGVGRRLLLEAERRIARRGGARVQAIVVETDVEAVGFWSASGWERQVERVRFVTG